MTLRSLAFSMAFVFTCFFTTFQASALDLAEARVGGAVVAEALSLGERDDWAGAEAAAARASDPVISDIVLWRKLRAGAGTMAEYDAYTLRRAGWPGQEALARVVFGESSGAQVSNGLSGAAAANWQSFAKLMRRDKYDAAEALLAKITGERHKLGKPEIWARRRGILVRRAARQGRAEMGYLLASQHHLNADDGYNYSDMEWLAGWIALRKLGDPARALVHFQRFNLSVGTTGWAGPTRRWAIRPMPARGIARRRRIRPRSTASCRRPSWANPGTRELSRLTCLTGPKARRCARTMCGPGYCCILPARTGWPF
jgi:soluble lytic murein transglycosylase